MHCKYSVIIPTFNRAAALDRALHSLVQQSYKNFEVLVSDDGSSDDTELVVSKYQNILKIHYIWNPNWGGPARPRNAAAMRAQGEWLCFLDADDSWHKDKLAFVDRFTSNYDVIYHSLTCAHESNPSRKIGKIKAGYLPKGQEFITLITKGNCIPTSATTVRKSCFDASGGFSEIKDLIAVEDFDLWLKLARNKCRFKRISKELGIYFISSTGDQISILSERFLCAVRTVFDMHQRDLSAQERDHSKACLAYTLGMLYVKSSMQDDAFGQLSKSIRSGTLTVKLKSGFRIIQLIVNVLNAKLKLIYRKFQK